MRPRFQSIRQHVTVGIRCWEGDLQTAARAEAAARSESNHLAGWSGKREWNL
jgi:hypothetical protein